MDWLQEDEQVLLDADRHPLSILDGLIGIGLGWAGVVGVLVWLQAFVLESTWWLIGIGVATVLAAWATLLLHWRRVTSRYVVTDQRLYHRYGRLRWNLLQTTYDKVTDLHVHQSLWGRWYGFGTVRVQTAGTGLSVAGVRDPFAWKQDVEDARTRFLHTLLGEHAPRHEQGAEAPAVQSRAKDGSTLWQGGPSTGWLAVSLAQVGFFLLIAIGFLVGGVAGDSFLLLPAGLFFVASVATAATRLIQFRYMRFHVTDSGVFVTSGWLSRRRVETTFAKVTDVTVAQDIPGRIFGYGVITVNTAGSDQAPVVFIGVHDPEAVKAVIDEARP